MKKYRCKYRCRNFNTIEEWWQHMQTEHGATQSLEEVKRIMKVS